MHMSTAKKNVNSLDTLSWKSCDVKRQIKVYTTTTRTIKARVVISLNPRSENINPPTIAKMTVDGLKGKTRSWLNTINLKQMYPHVCAANLIGKCKRKLCQGKGLPR